MCQSAEAQHVTSQSTPTDDALAFVNGFRIISYSIITNIVLLLLLDIYEKLGSIAGMTSRYLVYHDSFIAIKTEVFIS